MASLLSDLTYNQANELLARLGRAGLTTEQAKRLLADPDLVAQWVNAFPVTTTVANGLPTFRVTVNYDLAFQQMIEAGQYDYRNSDIKASRDAKAPADHFKLTGKGTQEIDIVLLHLNRDATTDQVLAEMERQGLRPATIEELLALGATHRELQREFPIVALGSRCLLGESESVPVLNGFRGKRVLDLGYCQDKWYDYYRFAAVRK